MPPPAQPGKRRLTAMLLRTLFLLLIAMGIIAGIVGCIQRRLIYHPQPYADEMKSVVPKRMIMVPYMVGGAAQQAYYLPPRHGDDPSQLWVLFNGNASLALWWLRWIEEDVAADDVAWLLVDYPGYGWNEGKPTRATIVQATEKVIPALAEALEVEAESLTKNINTLGFSLGAASAMEFAVRHPVKNVVLLAPFTSLEDMARRAVGWPLCNVLSDRFDNRARLDELVERSDAARIVILHGDRDSVVPFEHGKKLAELHPSVTRFVRVSGADHEGVVGEAAVILRELVTRDSTAPVP
jgi:pimeloyl-ACP methyl ester carboxylesterase